MKSPVEELLEKLLRPVRILVVEESSGTVQEAIQDHYDCLLDKLPAITEIKAKDYDIVFVDLSLSNALVILKSVKSRFPELPVVSIVEEQAVSKLLSVPGPIALLKKPVAPVDLDRVFKMFKLKAVENKKPLRLNTAVNSYALTSRLVGFA